MISESNKIIKTQIDFVIVFIKLRRQYYVLKRNWFLIIIYILKLKITSSHLVILAFFQVRSEMVDDVQQCFLYSTYFSLLIPLRVSHAHT